MIFQCEPACCEAGGKMWPLQVEQGKGKEGFPDKTKYDKAPLQDVRFSVL